MIGSRYQGDTWYRRETADGRLSGRVIMAGVAITLTDGELNEWAGRTLTLDEVRRLARCIPHSSIPQAVATIVGSWEVGQDRESYTDDQDRESYT